MFNDRAGGSKKRAPFSQAIAFAMVGELGACSPALQRRVPLMMSLPDKALAGSPKIRFQKEQKWSSATSGLLVEPSHK
jgi:hypothetical protein